VVTLNRERSVNSYGGDPENLGSIDTTAYITRILYSIVSTGGGGIQYTVEQHRTYVL
jgi:hypothetical protein